MRIGVMCSGGDAPGMNACLRAIVRTAVSAGHEVIGFRRGWQGILDRDLHHNATGQPLLSLRCVSNIVQCGGAILRSSRSDEFRTPIGVLKAARQLEELQVDVLIPIGGDGTFHGAVELAKHWNGQIVGCPGTIDNDLLGTDFTIGFSTAVATAVEAVDKLRDTAESHEMLFLIEVMGRHSGYIALYTALAGGAEVVCLPETPTCVPDIVQRLRELKQRGKTSIIVVVAEGDERGGAEPLLGELKSCACPFPMRTVILGHLQRGGSPTPHDRILAARLGDFAVRSALNGASGVMAGEIGTELRLTPFPETYSAHKTAPADLLALLETLAQ